MAHHGPVAMPQGLGECVSGGLGGPDTQGPILHSVPARTRKGGACDLGHHQRSRPGGISETIPANQLGPGSRLGGLVKGDRGFHQQTEL